MPAKLGHDSAIVSILLMGVLIFICFIVIFTAKNEDLEKLHFDTRQFNHIVYNTPEELKELLKNRIRATIL